MKKINLIAETAWHHDGDFDFMLDLINKIVSQSKTDIVKLHVSLDHNEYMMPDHPGFEMLSKKMFNEQQWSEIIELIKDSDKKLMLLLNDQKAIDVGMSFSPELVEIHAVCLNDIQLLNKLKDSLENDTVVVLGVGGSTLYEIEHAINRLNTNNIVLMHGFQNYPTSYHNINLKRIRKIMSLYPELKHGYADHTAWDEPNNILVTCMVAALGMDYVEKHVTTVPGQERIDWQAAIGIEQFNQIANYLNVLGKCEGDGLLQLNEGEKQYANVGPMKKAAFLNKSLKKGAVLALDDVAFKRTGQVSALTQLDAIDLIGKKAAKDLKPNTLLEKNIFE
jgi:N,N'-diacetyllegionaminate synthase